MKYEQRGEPIPDGWTQICVDVAYARQEAYIARVAINREGPFTAWAKKIEVPSPAYAESEAILQAIEIAN